MIKRALWLKRNWKWISFVVGNLSWIAPILAIFLIILLLFIPFLLFSLPDTFKQSGSVQQGGPSSYDWWNSPKQIDSDGTPYAWPVPQIKDMTSQFGEVRDNEVHRGLDIASFQGATFTALQPIYSIAAGTVQAAGPASGYGQWIVINHEDGLVSIYGHLESQMEVRTGDKVAKGQLIGRIGRGKVGNSTGSHLHLQLEYTGKPVDPLAYVHPPLTLSPKGFGYSAMNVSSMKSWLEKRKSALANDAILMAIDRAAKSQDVDPYLLIAITGQEQSFVPKNGNFADQIVRNPWNVFGCWCSGKGADLTTEESAIIAAKTIIKLSQNRPSTEDPISWINSRRNPNGFYAEDEGWWIGVSRFYKAIRSDVSI